MKTSGFVIVGVLLLCLMPVIGTLIDRGDGDAQNQNAPKSTLDRTVQLIDGAQENRNPDL